MSRYTLEGKLTCSKLILILVAISYFLGLLGISGLLIYIMIVYDDYNSAKELAQSALIYIGSPAAIAIGFYEWKAKHENVLKITKGLSQSNPEIAKDYYRQNSQSSEILSDDDILNQLINDNEKE